MPLPKSLMISTNSLRNSSSAKARIQALSKFDWFASALDGMEGTNVTSGLDRLVREEETRLLFAKAMKSALANPIPHGPDRIALMLEDIRTLDKTLRLRLNMLPLDRPQAWFRTSPPTDRSPIASTSWHDPIFLAFEESSADAVRRALPLLWNEKRLSSELYDPGFSLWGRLLKMNVALQKLNSLPPPFPDILLEDLPDAIPDDYQTPTLEVFGTLLSSRIKQCQRELKACYTFLWQRSEPFLASLYVRHLSDLAKRGQSFGSRFSGQESEKVPKRKLSPLEEALAFMNFNRLPNIDDLRHRYRSMAQALHPDRGGSEDHFHALSLHYQALLKHLQKF